MNCRFCGTALPESAAFCGECGRAVHAPSPTPPTTRQRISMPAIALSSDLDGTPSPVVVIPEFGFNCPQCGEIVAPEDVFCGECGFVVSSSSAPPVVDPRATAALDSEPTPWVEPTPLVEAEPNVVPLAAPPKVLRAVPDPFPWGKGPTSGAIDLEATRAVAGALPAERFVLQFSTGESVTVTGAGLVGRNPSSQPGEFVDQLVTIFDAGKSVSKTHLEFGQESGRFWVSDRYSTNGSTVRQPDAEPKRCDPGHRYFIARGTRVDIGEQFFVVS